ncbi:2-oxoglutarate and iron-dependent oxygenase domain-containing protein 3-like [Frankliniella occidentalis]|uniref:2-oxoglutarate and iron-dependent oxygenase domain-containing protein 3-like n=1 Tax=Frankliniella occidentalis TaxID=133901 RepID=A0A6J1S322_FRAOC|nr:2-oxoglutarate and iron-dependent oxygenase domain-containing protein 3-like [Frankliniella occidentalis]
MESETKAVKRHGKTSDTSKHREPSDRKGPVKDSKSSDRDESKQTGGNPTQPKFGPMPRFPHQRVWTRAIMIIALLIVVYFTSKNGKEVPLARQHEILHQRKQLLDCSESYQSEVELYPGCVPEKCGRLISDSLITVGEAQAMLEIAKRGLNLGGSLGGASILDLHSGALSVGRTFINMYMTEKGKNIYRKSDFDTYKQVRIKIHRAVAQHFKISPDVLYLTHPTFFSRLTNLPPGTEHDEYWHPHVDKDTYKSFHYTSLLYLSDYGDDFDGGRFIFIDKDNVNSTVEPRKGRVSMFTSGKENTHFVERVRSGTRFAMTISFTCDPKHAISDPNGKVIKRAPK